MSETIVALVPDAFGGRGGIALYDRLLLKALCGAPGVDRVIALPRSITYELEPMPANLQYEIGAAGGKLTFLAAAASLAVRIRSARLVVCGHLHLLPVAQLLSRRFHCPMLPVIYGREAWTPTPYRSVNRVCGRVSTFVSIRKVTADLFRAWAGIPDARMYYLPNAIELSDYGIAPRRPDLVARYGLEGRRAVMTAGRIENEPVERNKGFEEVLAALPMLAAAVPDIKYIIMGDGDGRPLLEETARALGVADRVVFTGYVAEKDKADHYRLADVVAMPGSHPSFDRYPFRFAFLEPLACGIPVVSTSLEAPTESNDPDARALLIQVDPTNPEAIVRGILEALGHTCRRINPVLSHFGFEVYERTVRSILHDIGHHQRTKP